MNITLLFLEPDKAASAWMCIPENYQPIIFNLSRADFYLYSSRQQSSIRWPANIQQEAIWHHSQQDKEQPEARTVHSTETQSKRNCSIIGKKPINTGLETPLSHIPNSSFPSSLSPDITWPDHIPARHPIPLAFVCSRESSAPAKKSALSGRGSFMLQACAQSIGNLTGEG